MHPHALPPSETIQASTPPLSDINVTPFVDVMLVLLIVFMITAPLLTTGVDVELPETQAAALETESAPIAVTIRKSGEIFLQESLLPDGELLERFKALAENDAEQRIYVRGDEGVAYGRVMFVMGALNVAGLQRVSLVTLPFSPAANPTPRFEP